MKYFASGFATLCLFVAGRAFAVTANFTLPSAATTSAGIYDANGVLVRTLWSNVPYHAGTFVANWNGIDDMGVLRPNGSYELRVLSNNVQYTWEGAVGNNSANPVGDTLHHGLDPYVAMAISGTSIYIAGAYQEKLPSATKTSTTNPQQRTKRILGIETTFYGVVTDDTYVYWAARDDHTPLKDSFLLVTKISDDTEASLSDATQITMTFGGQRYTSVLSFMSGVGTAITGLAVQKTGPYLFVARRDVNRLDVLDKTTGALIYTRAFNAPGALTIDGDDSLWMVKNTTQVSKYSVAPDGTLTLVANISGLSKPLALAVSPDGATLAVADGGTQQVMGFSTRSYTWQWELGQAGGYANGPSVENDKFFFRDTFSKNGEAAYLAYQSDGKLWVGDIGNSRTLRFDTTGVLDARIQYVPCFYSARVDQNDSTRVFANFLEFSIDYSKPLAADNGSWTLVRNWAWSAVGPYAGGAFPGGLRSITTLPAYGRTFALMQNVTLNKGEVVELPATGNLRFPGKFAPDNGWALDKDGAFRWQSKNCLRLVDADGTQITWKMQPFTGFDAADNPTWGRAVTVATSPVLSSRDICANSTWQAWPWEISSSGVLLAFQDDYAAAPDWHLQGLDTATGQWKFRAAPTTNENYRGPYPSDGSFDIGNGTVYAGGSFHASGRHLFWQYHGEFWRQGQTNKWMHLYDDGLVVGQFGVVTGIPGVRLGEAAAQMAGNALTSAVVTADDGSLYIYHCDESWHGGVHRWHVTHLDSIQEDSIPITLANLFQSGLQRTYYDETSLSRWQGFVKPRYSETYTFHASSDDGVRLWVDNRLVIDKWQPQTGTEWSGTVKLEADTLYQVRLEYFQHDSTASAQLSWSSASQTKEVVPSSCLFFTDVAPTFDGLNLHDGLWYNVEEVSDGLYGWHRDPAQNVIDSPTSSWTVDTSRYVYRKDLPVDIHASSSRDGDASVWRDLRPAGAAAVSSWTLSGNIAYGGNWNRDEYNPSGRDNIGQYLEMLDDAGRIIARMYPRNTPAGLIAIYANNTLTPVKTTDQWGATIVQTPVPFSIRAASGKLDFTFADGSAQQVSLFDPRSDWQKPATLRMFFFHARPNWGYSVDSSLSGVTFATTP